MLCSMCNSLNFQLLVANIWKCIDLVFCPEILLVLVLFVYRFHKIFYINSNVCDSRQYHFFLPSLDILFPFLAL